MNKNKYRVIFNTVRGLMMAVAEHVDSWSKPSSDIPASSGHSDEPMTAVLNPLKLVVWLMTGSAIILMPLPVSAAGIIADPAAAANQQPGITNAANGVPLVNIQTPSAAGVSRNTYSQFDVSRQGAILNNSKTNVQTQLGGWVQGNPNLSGSTARVILNEVNSSNPSLLNGYVEIAGSRAQLVIANPAGISCDGCGFINANHATLTTGTPILNSGNLLGYRVGGGVVEFIGAGLDATQANYTDVIARAVQVNADIFANELSVTTGGNQVSIDANGNQTAITAIAPDAGNSTPAFAVDVSALGGMYAGKIRLIGTEAGLGVHNASTIGASAGEVSITVDGMLQNSGVMNAKSDIQLNAVALENNQSIIADGNIDISLTSDFTHTSELQAGANLHLQTTGNFTNQSTLLASQSLTLSANNINNTIAGEIVGLITRVTATDTFTNYGLIDGVDTRVGAATFTNTLTGSVFGNHVAIQAAEFENDTGAVVAARNRLDIGAGSIENNSEGLIFSGGDLAIGGSLDGTAEAVGSADTLINDGSTIEALGNAIFAVTDLTNLNSNLVTDVVMTGTANFDRFTPRNASVVWDSSDYPGAHIGDVNVEWRNAGPYRFREYTRYRGTKRFYETRVISSNPGQILTGGNMVITGSVTNNDSQIIAGGNLDVSGATVHNLNSQGQTVTSYTGTSYYYDWDGNDNDYDVDIIGAYNPANSVQTYNLPTTRLNGNTSPVGSGTSVSSAPVPLLTNSLFQPNPDVTSSYLIETNPRFANYRTWLSSDYMMQQLSFDPTMTQKRLGDGFYEQRLVREQVAQLTGRRFLTGYASDEAQFQALMTSAVTQAGALQLVPGVALTTAQIAQLTSDIVWLIEQEVTLPDGSVIKALIPQVYVRLQDGDLLPTTGIMSGNKVTIALSGDLDNQGTIAGREFVALNAANIHNLGGQIAGGTVQLTAVNDLNNIGGQLIAEDAMLLTAGNDITLRSTTQSSQDKVGASSFSRTNLDRVAGLYMRNPDAILVASAGNDVNLMAASIVNQGENSRTQIDAARNINLDTVVIAEQNRSIRNAKNYVKHGSTQEVGSVVETAGAIAFNAGNDFNAKATSVTSEAGAINVIAAKDINITEGRETSNFDSARKVKKSGTFSSTTKTQRDVFKSDSSVNSSFSGDTVALHADDNINIRGSNVVSENGTSLIAGGNIKVAAAKDTAYEFHERKTKKSGLSTSGASVTLGTQKLDTNQTSDSTSHTSSTIGSVKGDIEINAAKTYTQKASDVLAPEGDIDISAQKVEIRAAQNVLNQTYETKFKQSGITVAITNPVISAIQTAQQMDNAASETDDIRMKALAAATTALGAKNATDAINKVDQYGNVPTAGNTGPDDVANVRQANMPEQVGGINVSVSVGSSKSESSTTQTRSYAQASQVMAGGDINIVAEGAGKNSDVNIIGSKVKAGENLSITAEDQLNLLAAKNTETLNSKNKGSSASLGVSYGTDGLLFSASASGNKGKANGIDATWSEAQVEAGGKVVLKSGTDASLVGAQVRGEQVVVNVGISGSGNLDIQSLQDTSTYKDKHQGVGGGFSVGAGMWGGSINYSDGKTNSDYASVKEQTGIFAGDEGFQVSVAGNTNLTGAVIASTEQAIQKDKNALSTETLTVSNIKNKAEYEADSTSMGGGYSSGGTLVGKDQQGDTRTGGAKVPGTALPSLNEFSATAPVALSAGGKDDSTTVSAISYGKLDITNDEAQRAKAGKDAATTVATLNRDVHIDKNGNAIDSQENNTANTLTPIYTDEVRAEINAGFEIVRALTNETSTFLANRAKEVDQAERDIKTELAKPEREQDTNRLNQLSQIVIDNQTWSMGGAGRTIITALTAAVSGNVTGTSGEFIQAATVNYLQSLGAQQIKQIADQVGGEGSAAHTALHAVLACAGGSASGGDCGTAALAASSGVVLNKLLDRIEGKDSGNFSAEEREARRNLITSLVTGITAVAGGDASIANAAVAIETENNALPAVFAAATAAVFFTLQAADITLTAWDSYQLTQALATGDDEKAEELIAGLAIGLATEAVPGNKIIQRVGEALGPLGNKVQRVVQAAGELASRSTIVNGKLIDASWRNADGKLEWLNPLTGKRELIPDGSKVHVDHVLPQKYIETLPEFKILPKEIQQKLLNDPSNLQPMLASANCSKGCRVEFNGTGWEAWNGKPIDPRYKIYLETAQMEFIAKLEKLK